MHLMTAKMIANRTTATTMGTTMASALTVSAEMTKKQSKLICNILVSFCVTRMLNENTLMYELTVWKSMRPLRSMG